MGNFVYYKEMKDYIKEMNITVKKCQFLKLRNFTSFCVLNQDVQTLKIYSKSSKSFQSLPYNLHLDFFGEIDENFDSINLITVTTKDGVIEFYADSEEKCFLFDIIFTDPSFDHQNYNLPEFLKFYKMYKGYDIEWVGENFQVTDYMTKKIVSCSSNLKQVLLDIDNFLAWKNNINLTSSFYENLGFKINIVSSSKSYPAFPYTFEILKPNGELIKFDGISNVFEDKESAHEKACFVINNLINY